MKSHDSKGGKIRFAVVGLGHISQVAILPSFRHCKNAELTALVSSDAEKRDRLAKMYRVKRSYSYDQFQECLDSGEIDAVYIALPNHLHKDYSIRAARSGIHILCEKPMAVTTQECQEMIDACEQANVRLMIAYRLHFETSNLTAIDLVTRKKIGDPKMFQSIHSQVAAVPNVRLLPVRQGGGPTYDMGIYDINAARYIFQAEPESVFAQATHSDAPGFEAVEESMSVILRFPDSKLASIIYSYGAADTDTFRVVGTRGDLTLNPAYGYVGSKELTISVKGKRSKKIFPANDHFAGELDYFACCVQKNQEPEPSGCEGMADVRIIEAIHESAQRGRLIKLKEFALQKRPSIDQAIRKQPVVGEPSLVHAKAPTKKAA